MSKDEAQIEAEIQAKGLNAPRLTPELIDAAIVSEQYHVFPGTTLTVCALTLRNGYIVTGESAAASPSNFNQEIGRKISRDNARNKIWALEGAMSMYDRIQDGPYTGKGISAGASLGIESAKIGKLEKRSALSENADTLSDARRLACRVQHLVDRFCGRIPTTEGNAEDNSTMAISPILDDLREDAARTGYEVRRAMERLDHLEAQLP